MQARTVGCDGDSCMCVANVVICSRFPNLNHCHEIQHPMWLTAPYVLPHLPLQGGSTVMPTGAVVMPPSYMPGACLFRTQGQRDVP